LLVYADAIPDDAARFILTRVRDVGARIRTARDGESDEMEDG
jgi:hypothetical protein